MVAHIIPQSSDVAAPLRITVDHSAVSTLLPRSAAVCAASTALPYATVVLYASDTTLATSTMTITDANGSTQAGIAPFTTARAAAAAADDALLVEQVSSTRAFMARMQCLPPVSATPTPAPTPAPTPGWLAAGPSPTKTGIALPGIAAMNQNLANAYVVSVGTTLPVTVVAQPPLSQPQFDVDSRLFSATIAHLRHISDNTPAAVSLPAGGAAVVRLHLGVPTAGGGVVYDAVLVTFVDAVTGARAASDASWISVGAEQEALRDVTTFWDPFPVWNASSAAASLTHCTTPGFQLCTPVGGGPPPGPEGCIGALSAHTDCAQLPADAQQQFEALVCGEGVAGALDNPACACVLAPTSRVRVPVGDTMYTLPEFLAAYETSSGASLPQEVVDRYPCWWPACAAPENALPALSGGSAVPCDDSFTNCFAYVGSTVISKSPGSSVCVQNACGGATAGANAAVGAMICDATTAAGGGGSGSGGSGSGGGGSSGAAINMTTTAFHKRHQKVPLAAVVAIAVGCAAFALVVVLAVCIGLQHARKRK